METVTEPRMETGPEPQEPPEAFGDGDPAGTWNDDLHIEGDGQLSFEVSGKHPTSSTLRIVGGSIEIEGQMDKGQLVPLAIEVQITGISFVDKLDSKTGQIVGCERRHTGRIKAVRR